MVELTREEFEILWYIEEGNAIPEGLASFLDYSLEDIKNTFVFLHKYGLIELNTSGDLWNASTTEKAKDMYSQYEHWIP